MVALPEPRSPTVDAIYESYEHLEAAKPPSTRLGASRIGDDCSRRLWFSFRWCGQPQFPGRVLRLFETGHLEEARLIQNLRALGVEVYDRDPETGGQFTYSAVGGHFGGSLDGVARGLREAPKSWAVLEIKTANEASFDELQRLGVKVTKPLHYAQMVTYMGFSELERAAYFAVCKNDDRIHSEWIPFDKPLFAALLDKARRIIEAPEPLTKLSENPDAPSCRWCDFRRLCHEARVPPVSCRTCAHATPLTDGEGARWRCERHHKLVSRDEQRAACDEHLFIPALIPYAEPVDAGDDWIAYQLRGRDQYFVNCGASGFPVLDIPHYASSELAVLHPDAIGHPAVEAARRLLGGTIVAGDEDNAGTRFHDTGRPDLARHSAPAS